MKIHSFRQFKRSIRSFLAENKDQIVYGEKTVDIINAFEKKYPFLNIYTQCDKFFEKQKGCLFETFCIDFYIYYLENKYDMFSFYQNMTFFLVYPSEKFFDIFFDLK